MKGSSGPEMNINYKIVINRLNRIAISKIYRNKVRTSNTFITCFQMITCFEQKALHVVSWIIINAMSKCDDHQLYTLKEVFQDFIGPIHLPYDVAPAALQYKQIYSSPWAPNIELERRHEELTQKICQWPVKNTGENVKVDNVMVTCLGQCLMFNTDFITLKDPKRVNKVQMRYIKLLQRYLKSRHDISYANTHLHNGLMIGSFAREAMEICQKRLPV